MLKCANHGTFLLTNVVYFPAGGGGSKLSPGVKYAIIVGSITGVLLVLILASWLIIARARSRDGYSQINN